MSEAQQVQVYQGQSSSLQTESVVQSFTGELEVENVTDQISHDDKSVPTTAPISSMSDTLAEQLYLSTIVQDTVMHSDKKSNEIANDSYVIIRTSEDPVQVDTTTSAVLQAPDSNALLNAIHLASVESLENDHLKNSDDVDHTLNGVTLHSIPKSKGYMLSPDFNLIVSP
ncbi:PREDICTED: uncharacterized protein LOC106819004 [Priapulus caudatus]|uniref:Uncharacterized protein LOC106819004 n=1 Tax=Priapulus caudatus TaxID=37621 RepID=A0ABM1F3Y3_PRICU|nr:PREDICTED: uncharacterized protein LOC106819004 [Priapulus caudatus]